MSLLLLFSGTEVTVDKWFEAFAEPQLVKRSRDGWLAFVPVVSTAEVVTVDKWFEAFAEPSRVPARFAAQQQTLAFVARVVAEGTVTVDKWYQAFSEPNVKTRQGLIAALQQTLAYSESAQFPAVVAELPPAGGGKRKQKVQQKAPPSAFPRVARKGQLPAAYLQPPVVATSAPAAAIERAVEALTPLPSTALEDIKRELAAVRRAASELPAPVAAASPTPATVPVVPVRLARVRLNDVEDVLTGNILPTREIGFAGVEAEDDLDAAGAAMATAAFRGLDPEDASLLASASVNDDELVMLAIAKSIQDDERLLAGILDEVRKHAEIQEALERAGLSVPQLMQHFQVRDKLGDGKLDRKLLPTHDEVWG